MPTRVGLLAAEGREQAIPPATVRLRPRLILALSRVEVRKLLLHPAFLGGLALGVPLVVLATGGAGSGGGPRLVFAVVGFAIGLLGGTMLSANMCALRARRDRMGELFGSLPAPPEARTSALLIAAVAGPAVVGALLCVAAFPVLASDPELGKHVDLPLLGMFPLTAAALGAFGVALGRWIPSPFAAPVTLVAHMVTPIGFVIFSPWLGAVWNGSRSGWHYTYFLGVICLWSSLAVARDGRRRPSFAAAGVAAAVVVASAILQRTPGAVL